MQDFFKTVQLFLAAPMQDKVVTVLFVMSISMVLFVMSISLVLWVILQLLKL